MKKALKEFLETEGYEFTWDTQCTECYEDFRCQEFLPDKIIKKMVSDKTDDVVSEFVGNTSDERFHYCPKCRKEMGMD